MTEKRLEYPVMEAGFPPRATQGVPDGSRWGILHFKGNLWLMAGRLDWRQEASHEAALAAPVRMVMA